MMRRVNIALRTVCSTWLMILAVYASKDAEVSTRCPANMPYTSKMAIFRDTCYQFVSTEKYWDEARDMCWAWGGKLVEINNADTNHFLMNTLNSMRHWSNNGLWIGLHDRTMELVWRWIGTKQQHDAGEHPPAPTFAYWERKHPGNWFHSMKDCVRMDRGSGWRWKETACAGLKWHYRFICQYPAVKNIHSGGLRNRQSNITPESKNRQLSKIPNDAMKQEAEAPLYMEESSFPNGTALVVCIIVGVLIVSVVVMTLLLIRRRHIQKHPSEALVIVTCSDKCNNPLYEDGQAGLAQCLLNQPRQPQPQNDDPCANVYVSPEEMAGTGAVAAKDDVYLSPVDIRKGKRPLPECPGEESQPHLKPVCGYLPMDAASRRGSTDTLEMGLDDVGEEDDQSPGFNYDTPKAGHIYSEIPCDEGNVYEALDDVKY